jgi:hypothetical protein
MDAKFSKGGHGAVFLIEGRAVGEGLLCRKKVSQGAAQHPKQKNHTSSPEALCGALL